MNHLRNLARQFATVGASIFISVSALMAQSGDVSGPFDQFRTLGSSILNIALVLTGMAFVGLLIWGGVTLSTNRPRGLAMIAGGLVGALLSGLAFVIVNTLTGRNVAPGMLLFPLW